ncbi:hypothetical protein C8Q78DRAFT_945336, partial [Trametes maxima]
NGLWVGEQPSALSGLTFAEQLVIARSRHSFCVAEVARSHQRFLAANVVVFGQPIDRLYDVLPPPCKEIELCLAILFVGHATPTDEDVRRTPFLIRRNVVLNTLRWLKLNNRLYAPVEISMENLNSFPDDRPPVGILNRPGSDATPSEAAAPVYDGDPVRAVGDGEASFVVHTLDAPDLAHMTYEAKVALAISHFERGGAAIAYGHNKDPE